jgi:hypothetical protein
MSIFGYAIAHSRDHAWSFYFGHASGFLRVRRAILRHYAATFGSRLLSSLFFKSLVTWSFNIKTTP